MQRTLVLGSFLQARWIWLCNEFELFVLCVARLLDLHHTFGLKTSSFGRVETRFQLSSAKQLSWLTASCEPYGCIEFQVSSLCTFLLRPNRMFVGFFGLLVVWIFPVSFPGLENQ